MSNGSSNLSLGEHMLRTAWLFQGLAALPITVILGGCAFAELFGPYMYLYDFITDGTTALMAAGIIFIVLIQRKIRAADLLTFQFEIGKATLATGLWLWLILDSAFGPWQRRRTITEPEKQQRLVRSAFASILLFVLFYPAASYAYLMWKRVKPDRPLENGEDAGSNERTPLLSA